MPRRFKQTPNTKTFREQGLDRAAAAIEQFQHSGSYLRDSFVDGHVSRRKVYYDWLALPLGSSLLQGVGHCCCE